MSSAMDRPFTRNTVDTTMVTQDRKPALGLIETEGLVAAIEGADAAVKAAKVHLRGLDRATGGIITVRLEGLVADVQAAVAAGGEAARRVGALRAIHVIPRPDPSLAGILGNGRPPSSGGDGGVDGGPGKESAPAAKQPSVDTPSGDQVDPREDLGPAHPPSDRDDRRLERLTVSELRQLVQARGLMAGQAVRRARKAVLVERLRRKKAP